MSHSIWGWPKRWQPVCVRTRRMATCSHSDKLAEDLAKGEQRGLSLQSKMWESRQTDKEPLHSALKGHKLLDGSVWNCELLTRGHGIVTECPFLSGACHASITVGPRTIEWCLYVMTPWLKPDYPQASDITGPRHPSPGSRSSLTIWRLLEDARSHEFNGQARLLLVAARPTLAGAVILQLSPGPITGTALFPRLDRFENVRRRSELRQRSRWGSAYGLTKKKSQTHKSLAKHFIYSLFPHVSCKLEQLQPFTVLIPYERSYKKTSLEYLPHGQIECKFAAYCKNNTFV